MTNFKKVMNYLWLFVKYTIGTIVGTISAISQVIGGFLSGVALMLIMCAIAGSIIYAKVRPMFEEARQQAYDKLSNIDDSTFTKNSDTEVYDSNGNQIGLISAGHYEYVSIDKISPYIQNGYIAVEDKRYKEHIGIDYISIARAFVSLVKHNGDVKQGGSTIDQQVVKNCLLTQEKTFSRKLVEVMIAPYIDNRFGKDKVMEFYCNTNYYGHRCYGVQAASRYYFGKDADDLEVWEAALLCRISNSPSKYDPVKHPKKAIEGRNFVLKEMLDTGYINEDTYKKAKEQSLSIVQEYAEGTNENYQTSYAIHCAALELMKNDGFEFKYIFNNKESYEKYKENYSNTYNEKTEEIRAGGYKIYTTLNSDIQNVAQKNLDSVLDKFKDVDEKTGKYTLQGAAVVVDNQTNNVVAIVGGRGTDDLFNRGYLSYRQPGSTIKPLLDYAPAFDTGEFSPSSKINDTEIENGPSNSGGGYRGWITIREALNRSINTVAWQLLQNVGVENGINHLGNMDFLGMSYIDTTAPAIAIGGFTNGTRVVDMAKGYSTLANYGVYNDKTCIKDVEFKGKSVYKQKPISRRVYSEDTSYMVTDVLKGTMDKEYGTGHGLDINGQQAAGKTGTTNDNKDAWFCGYTRYYTTAVWMGYDVPKKMTGIYGATYAGKIWKNIMTELHKDLAEWDWERPDTVYEANYDAHGKETTAETGMRDLFSSNAKNRLDEILSEKRANGIYEEANKKVAEYEHWYINNVEDTELVEEKYNEAVNEACRVEDNIKRSELLERVNNHKDEIDTALLSWKDAIELYNKNKEEEEAARLVKESEEAEENRLKVEKEQKIERFRVCLNKLAKAEYQDTDNYSTYIGEARESLDDCRQYDEYVALSNELKSAIEHYNSLPTYDEWYMTKTAMEESKRDEEERLKDEADKQMRQEMVNEPTVGN